jgi:putative flippase GtrA
VARKVTLAKMWKLFVFAITYSFVGLFGLAANVGSFMALQKLGVPLNFATGIAFLIGGQVSFVAHDRITFGNTIVKLKRWQQRWRRLITGQLVGFLVNWAVANTLILIGGIDTWKIYLAATLCGAIVTITWAKYYSHKQEPDDGPAEPRDESAPK